MNDASIPGNFTNHSLRSTTTTRLFNAQIDEQLIMSRTGHSSTVGVRSYKCTSDQLLECTSKVLNRKRHNVEVDPASNVTANKQQQDVPNTTPDLSLPSGFALNLSGCTVNISINNYSK